jgi:putative colanic acid biosynthesis acetyltransferase WcaB
MKNIINFLLQDRDANQDTSSKSRLILLLFRSTQIIQNLPILFSPLKIISQKLYTIITEWILGVELPCETQVGENLKLLHGIGLVINGNTVIGRNCILRHCTTIGNKQLTDGSYSTSPVIGNNVDIGSNVVIIGAINIGDNAIIGAGSVVVKDVPKGAIVAGNPAKIIRTTFLEECNEYQELNQLNVSLFK